MVENTDKSPADDVITVALHPALRAPFEEWLATRNFILVGPVPVGDDEEDSFYFVAPNQL